MSRRVVCNQCGTEAPLTEYGLPPAGWLVVTVQGPPYVDPIDLCGAACALLQFSPPAAPAGRPGGAGVRCRHGHTHGSIVAAAACEAG